MQDGYAGDIGDFGKLVLLRQLLRVGGPDLRLGVNWYRATRVEHKTNDGRHIAYLKVPSPSHDRFDACDPDLLRRLRDVVNDRRSVAALEASGILPPKTLFFADPLPYGSPGLAARQTDREAWFERSLGVLDGANVLFLDPDNGIASPRVRKTQTRAIKYAFRDEIRSYYAACDMLIIYNHRDRTPAGRYAMKFLDLRKNVDPSAHLRVLRFKRTSVRDYVFLTKRRFEPLTRALFARLTAEPFDFLFEELQVREEQ